MQYRKNCLALCLADAEICQLERYMSDIRSEATGLRAVPLGGMKRKRETRPMASGGVGAMQVASSLRGNFYRDQRPLVSKTVYQNM